MMKKKKKKKTLDENNNLSKHKMGANWIDFYKLF